MISASRIVLPLALSAIAFVTVEHLRNERGQSPPALSPALEQPVRATVASTVALQVAVHDLVEAASSPVAVRVCRSLANRLVTVQVTASEPMSAVLENLAGQVGVHVVLGIEHPQDRVLPTIPCPAGGAGDYLTIGMPGRDTETLRGATASTS